MSCGRAPALGDPCVALQLLSINVRARGATCAHEAPPFLTESCPANPQTKIRPVGCRPGSTDSSKLGFSSHPGPGRPHFRPPASHRPHGVEPQTWYRYQKSRQLAKRRSAREQYKQIKCNHATTCARLQRNLSQMRLNGQPTRPTQPLSCTVE